MENQEEKMLIGVVGCGAMGTGIAQVSAQAGHRVIIFDTDKNALERSRISLDSTLLKLAEKGKISPEEGRLILSKIIFAYERAEFSGCNLIIEAVIENLEIKQKLFSDLEKIVSDNCILATNTSSLSITSISSACKKPDRVIGIHFFNPAPIMPLVEIIPGISTDKLLASQMKKLIFSLGKIPVIAKDTPGFIVNRVARPFYGEAIRIFEEGLVSHKEEPEIAFATIDWAMKEIGGFRMGPFELMDLIGNDVNYTVTDTVWKQFFYDPKFKPSLTQKRLFEARRFGKKNGRGYYNYSAPLPEPEKNLILGKQIFERILIMLINEAADALYYRIATKEDIDLAMTKGVNYPKGLLKWADDLGINFCLKKMEELYDEYQEDRYRPSMQLKKMVQKGIEKFY